MDNPFIHLRSLSSYSLSESTLKVKNLVSMAKKNDIILIAGKGHENYQEIKGVKHPFDDMKKILEILNKFNK